MQGLAVMKLITDPYGSLRDRPLIKASGAYIHAGLVTAWGEWHM